jgi:hypothetical protein
MFVRSFRVLTVMVLSAGIAVGLSGCAAPADEFELLDGSAITVAVVTVEGLQPPEHPEGLSTIALEVANVSGSDLPMNEVYVEGRYPRGIKDLPEGCTSDRREVQHFKDPYLPVLKPGDQIWNDGESFILCITLAPEDRESPELVIQPPIGEGTRIDISPYVQAESSAVTSSN